MNESSTLLSSIVENSALISGGVISLSSLVIGILLNHFFERRRKIDEMLFNARREVYAEFIQELGSLFFEVDSLERKLSFELKSLDTAKHKNINERDARIKELRNKIDKNIVDLRESQKIARLFSRCRLVAGPLLEIKLRDLYGIISDERKSGVTIQDRVFIAYEVEALMRRDLRVIGYFELLNWRVLSWRNRKKKETD